MVKVTIMNLGIYNSSLDINTLSIDPIKVVSDVKYKVD